MLWALRARGIDFSQGRIEACSAFVATRKACCAPGIAESRMTSIATGLIAWATRCNEQVTFPASEEHRRSAARPADSHVATPDIGAESRQYALLRHWKVKRRQPIPYSARTASRAARNLGLLSTSSISTSAR